MKDIHKIQEYIDKGASKYSYMIFIDEGSHFRHREPHLGSEWIDWGNFKTEYLNVSILLSKDKNSKEVSF